LSAALEAVGSENGSLLLLDENKNELVFVDVIGANHEALSGYRIPADQGVAGWMIQERSPVLIEHAHQDKRWSAHIDETLDFYTAALIGVPLLEGNRPLGVIEIVNPLRGDSFHEGDLDILLLVGRLATMAIVRAENATREEAAP